MSRILAKIKAERDALNQRIAEHKPLAHNLAVKKLCTYVTEHSMTEEELFPTPRDPEYDYEKAPEPAPEPYFWDEPFPEFEYEDTFGYTFIEDLTAQRNELDWEIRAIRREAIERARVFIREYKLTKQDVFPSLDQGK